jgi:hypothetical protein
MVCEDAKNSLTAILRYTASLALQWIWADQLANNGEKYSCTPATLQYICRGFSER